jgi:hypothetical protein
MKSSTMATGKRNRAVAIYAGLYWIGIIMTLACLAIVLTGNTEFAYRFEHTGFPLSWAATPPKPLRASRAREARSFGTEDGRWRAGRKGGLVYLRKDLRKDGLHPSDKGNGKIPAIILQFFKADRATRRCDLGLRGIEQASTEPFQVVYRRRPGVLTWLMY